MHWPSPFVNEFTNVVRVCNHCCPSTYADEAFAITSINTAIKCARVPYNVISVHPTTISEQWKSQAINDPEINVPQGNRTRETGRVKKKIEIERKQTYMTVDFGLLPLPFPAWYIHTGITRTFNKWFSVGMRNVPEIDNNTISCLRALYLQNLTSVKYAQIHVTRYVDMIHKVAKNVTVLQHGGWGNSLAWQMNPQGFYLFGLQRFQTQEMTLIQPVCGFCTACTKHSTCTAVSNSAYLFQTA